MNNQWNCLWVAVLAWSVACVPLLAEPPLLRHITATVTVDSSNDYQNISGSSEKSRKQGRQLNIVLANYDRQLVKDVSVKWAIYAHKMDNHKLVTVKQGTRKTTLEAHGTATVKSDRVTIKGTPKHSVITRKTIKGKVQTHSKSQPATGEEYYGYSVEVYAGSVLIDGIYSQPSLKPGNP
ncbi:MAG: hypothetical protein NTV46_05195 [Verrucomicrobia bacterium]|nr:hypothetical protein [Verrucomicrobiota bacterium]